MRALCVLLMEAEPARIAPRNSIMNLSSAVTSTTPGSGPSLRSLALRGSAWTLVGHGVAQVLRLGSNLVMTRLLFPEAFGLMALVSALMMGLQMFSDIGVGASVVQHERGDDPKFYNTAFTMQVLRGLGLWLIACALSLPIANFYDQPILAAMLPLVCFSSAIQGFQSTAFISLYRHMALGRLTLLQTACVAIRIAVMIVWAWISPTVWALVAGHLTEALVRTVLSHFMVRDIRNRFCWDAMAARDMLGYGRWIFFSTVFTFAAAQADRFMLGKLVSVEMLGVYMVAVTWAMMPIEVLNKIGESVVFPLCSRMKASGRSLIGTLQRVRQPVSVGGAVIVGGMAILGDTLIGLLYDDRYSHAGAILQIMSAVVWFEVLTITAKAAVFALGKSQWGALGNGVKFAGMMVLAPTGFHYWGIQGLVWGLAISQAARHIVFLIGMRRMNLPGAREDVLATLLLVASIALGMLVTDRAAAAGMHVLPSHALGFTALLACWLLPLWRLRLVLLMPQPAVAG